MTSSSPYGGAGSAGGNRAAYSPSAPPVPDYDEPKLAHPYVPSRANQNYNSSSLSSSSFPYTSQSYGQPQSYGYSGSGSSSNYGSSGQAPYSYGYSYPPYQQQQYHGYNSFPPGTHPDVIRSFQMVDRDRSGFIEDKELQEALSSGYQRFNIRAIRLLISLFKNPSDPALRVGPKGFAELWNCLGQWRVIFERFDEDRSGKIDGTELRDALHSLGYLLPPSVLQVLISRYDDGSGRRVELNFDSFVECGMIVKGLTEKFKEKDSKYTGRATLSYDTFMSMIIPFLVSY